MMNRRDAIARVGLLMGGTVLGAEAFLSGCTKPVAEVSTLDFSSDTVDLLDEVGETILPTTAKSPGAKAAQIGEFIKIIVTDCYEEKDQRILAEGITALRSSAVSQFNKPFIEINAQQKHAFISALDVEAKAYDKSKKKEEPTHYFTMIKQLTLWGYFTSEVGSQQALRYVPVPGRYEGCTNYIKGEGAWSDI